MEILNKYYEENFGYEPEEEIYLNAKATVETLKENGYDDNEIFEILTTIGKEDVTQDLLPESLWDDSLLDKDKFYYNKELRLMSPPSMFNPLTGEIKTFPFYLEMKIKYTIDDILNKYYIEMDIPYEMQDRTRDAGQIRFLLGHYGSRMEFISNVDFVLILIKLPKEKDEQYMVTEPFKLRSYEKDALIRAKAIVLEAKGNKEDSIVWRKGR